MPKDGFTSKNNSGSQHQLHIRSMGITVHLFMLQYISSWKANSECKHLWNNWKLFDLVCII